MPRSSSTNPVNQVTSRPNTRSTSLDPLFTKSQLSPSSPDYSDLPPLEPIYSQPLAPQSMKTKLSVDGKEYSASHEFTGISFKSGFVNVSEGLLPAPFRGEANEDAELWWSQLNLGFGYATYQETLLQRLSASYFETTPVIGLIP